MTQESHQVKHWQINHPEMEDPPVFKFKIVSTFKDPLTRQHAESVRIERRGPGTLNSKAKYSCCRVPRLRVDMEDWQGRTNKKDVQMGSGPNLSQEVATSEVTPAPACIDVEQEEERTGWRMRSEDRK